MNKPVNWLLLNCLNFSELLSRKLPQCGGLQPQCGRLQPPSCKPFPFQATGNSQELPALGETHNVESILQIGIGGEIGAGLRNLVIHVHKKAIERILLKVTPDLQGSNVYPRHIGFYHVHKATQAERVATGIACIQLNVEATEGVDLNNAGTT